MSWIIGTAVLWILKLLTIPFAKLLAGDRVKKVTTPGPAPAMNMDMPADDAQSTFPSDTEPVADIQVQQSQAPVKTEEQIPNGFYILADVIIMGVAGGLLGLLSGYYFIGFSWKPRDWPGMMVFIIASLAGSYIHG